jgi:hypothetical protein
MQQVQCTSTTPATLLVTQWMLAAGTTAIDAVMEVRAPSPTAASFNAAMRVRFASVSTQRPGAWGTATTTRSSADVWPERFDVSATTDQAWVQVGLVGNASAAQAEALVRLQAAAQGGGAVLAEQVVQVEPDTNSGSYTVVALGNPFAQLGISKVMYAVVFSGVTGTVTYRPVYRQFKGNPELPEAWGDLGTGDSTRTTDGDLNSGLISVSPTSGYLLGQAGLKYTGTARGTLKTMVCGVF